MSVKLKYLLDPNHDRYNRSKKHELRIAKLLGGRRLPNSGGARRSRWDANQSQGGDIETAMHIVECKRTETKSMSVKREWWTKVCEGAALRRKLPALVLTFEQNGREPEDLVVMSLTDVLRLCGQQLGCPAEK